MAEVQPCLSFQDLSKYVTDDDRNLCTDAHPSRGIVTKARRVVVKVCLCFACIFAWHHLATCFYQYLLGSCIVQRSVPEQCPRYVCA